MTPHQNYATGEYREIADLTETERHRLLAAERRRILITILSSSSSPMEMDTLARKVVKQEAGLSTVDEATVDRMKGILHHTAIPMLTNMGMVRANPDTNQLEFAENWSY